MVAYSIFQCLQLTSAIFLFKIHVLLAAVAGAVTSAVVVAALIDLKIQLWVTVAHMVDV